MVLTSDELSEVPFHSPGTSTPYSSSSFISDENLCGGTLLQLVGRGHVIIAQLLKLSSEIPPAFLLAAQGATPGGESAANTGERTTTTTHASSPSSSSGGGLGASSSSSLWALFGYSTQDAAAGESSLSTRLGEDDNPSTKKSPKSGNSTHDSLGSDSAVMPDEARFVPLLFDFAYQRDPEQYETRLKSTKIRVDDVGDGGGAETAEDLEALFVSLHSEALIEFHGLFDGIFQYQEDLNRFVTDLTTGYYIQYHVESVLLDVVGRQLLCEGVYLYGMMLILMERYFQGPVRERLIIAYIRYCNKNGNDTRIRNMCKLCRSTGRQPFRSSREENKVPGLEDKLFTRFPLPEDLVRNIIGCLMSEDIFQQSRSFPNFEHRSSRFAKQAAMLYVILFFNPRILNEEMGTMREIVDKNFNDNWVIALYDGTIVDLSSEWKRFNAAKTALENVLLTANVKRLHVDNAKLMAQCIGELRRSLAGGFLTDRYVLDNTNNLLNCMRRCNVALRWRILHRRVSDKKFRSIICASGSDLDFPVLETHILTLLLFSAQFELKVKDVISRLLQKKSETWSDCRTKAAEHMAELSDYFKGDQALSTTRHEGLIEWFAGMAKEINLLDYDTKEEHSTVTGRKIQLCVQALDEVASFDLIDRDLQVKKVLKQTKDLLLQMVRAVSIKDDICATIDCITDMSYGREVLSGYVNVIHERVKKDPSSVVLLRSLFLKLSSILSWPTARLDQCRSPDVAFVTRYYSSSIIVFVREVLDIIPISVFSILTRIVDIKEKKLAQLPLKIEVEMVQEYSQPEERYNLARLTHELSIFTEGILSMEKTVVGEVEVNPHGLLEDGIRKELVRQLSLLFHHAIQFPPTTDNGDIALVKYQENVVRSLQRLASRMEGFRGSFEYIQDYIRIGGLSIWIEEASRIVGYNVEQESSKYTLKKIPDSESIYQSPIKPVPRFPRTETEKSCVNFMGRMVSALLKMTDPRLTIYSRDCSGWFLPDGHEMCGGKMIGIVRKSLGVNGISGIDRLLSFRIVNEFQRFLKFYRTTVKPNGMLLEQIRDGLFPEWKTPPDAIQFYESATKKTEKLMVPIMTCVCRVGHAQLLRKSLRTELMLSSRVHSNALFQSLSMMNEAVINSTSTNSSRLSEKPTQSSHETDFIDLISDLSAATGYGDPMATVFFSTDPLECLPVLLLLFLISLTPKLLYDSKFKSLVRAKEAYPIDGWPVVAGIMTLLKQFHPSYTKSFLTYLGQFVRFAIQKSIPQGQPRKGNKLTLPLELRNALIFARQLCSIGNIPQSVLHDHIPQDLFEICAAA